MEISPLQEIRHVLTIEAEEGDLGYYPENTPPFSSFRGAAVGGMGDLYRNFVVLFYLISSNSRAVLRSQPTRI